jgi:hypothetical protein
MLNTPVDTLPVNPNSTAWINNAGAGIDSSTANSPLYADFNSVNYNGGIIGIPYNVVQNGNGHMVNVNITDYPTESSPGPYLMPNTPPKVEGSAFGPADAYGELGGPVGSGDGHLLVLDADHGISYELFTASQNADGSWNAGSGAIFNLSSNAEHTPLGDTSACAWGGSLFQPLIKYEEVRQGAILHACGITFYTNGNVWPGNGHLASKGSGPRPPLGAMGRLKASVDISQAPPQSKIILTALKKYGFVVQENGAPFYLNGDPHDLWDPLDLHWIKDNIKGSDLEFVDPSQWEIDPSSMQASAPSGISSVGSIGSENGSVSGTTAVHHTKSTPRAH